MVDRERGGRVRKITKKNTTRAEFIGGRGGVSGELQRSGGAVRAEGQREIDS